MGTRRILVLLAKDFDIAMAELKDLLADLCAALPAWLCDGVVKQQQTPGQAEEHQKHTQFVRHAPTQQTAQHGNAAGLMGPGLRGWGGDRFKRGYQGQGWE